MLLLAGPALAQSLVPTPQEEERAREALRAAMDGKPDGPSPLDPHPASGWDVPAAADIAPGLHADLFQPSTEIMSAVPEGDWLPGSGMPREERAAASASPDEETAEPPKLAKPPAARKKIEKSRTVRKTHSTLRSGRASLDSKPGPPKKSRPKAERAAPKTPALTLPGELRP